MNTPEIKRRIFLIIGLTKESGHWDDHFIAKLRDYFQTDEIIAIDLPGTGQFHQQKSPFSIEGIVKAVKENYQDQFDPEYENILISISLGGMIATQWLKQYPGDFQKLVVINSSFKGFSPLYKRVRPWAMKQFVKVLLAPNFNLKEKYILNLCVNQQKNHEHTYAKWLGIAQERPISRENMIRQGIAGARFSPSHGPDIPTLVIAAKHDKLAHYTCSEVLEKKWSCELRIIEHAHVGHSMHVDDPELLAGTIYEWYQQK